MAIADRVLLHHPAPPGRRRWPSPPFYSEKQLNNIFWRFDENGDCRLSWRELKEAFKELGALFPGYRAYRALRYADENEDGYMSEDEMDRLLTYAYALHYRKPLTKQQLELLFYRVDGNRDGFLSKQELKSAFDYLGALFPSYRATMALHYADCDRDGFIREPIEFEMLTNYTLKLGYKLKDEI